jgi:hypothetical protein
MTLIIQRNQLIRQLVPLTPCVLNEDGGGPLKFNGVGFRLRIYASTNIETCRVMVAGEAAGRRRTERYNGEEIGAKIQSGCKLR